ncbi:glyoxalase [Enterococcus phoeniculicola]|jgi:catechol 2,3-dioxygenase|uniref:Glyoxalase n=1 Tax=Enterococcus phoeniculicola ATCC BAA-412 TaxID=1158610 RepID=R3WKV6_9ENTE|nr:VOC family protein [Enterococcus phoeniculicola]EOL42485.1 glyoxalase [Enterococcus phoeniculicola ATCC BAA-412]EOT79236.1 glyoxalase [Enterococcus phoeniculicola ATCC BAA-412]OJG73228.1 glyoxalase [Enterococcus phoeniculicola]
MSDFVLEKTTYLKSVAIRVKDRDAMIHFYRDVVGFDLKREENELAIFGTQETGSELLLLEESPRADEHSGEIKKLHRFSLTVPSEEEMANVLTRIRKAEYPIENALEDDDRLGILLVDPEGNEIGIYYSEVLSADTATAEPMDQEELLKKADEAVHVLASGTRFDKVHLNVSDLDCQRKFLDEVLGLSVQNENNGIMVLNEGDFHVGLNEAQGGTIDLPTDSVLGLDFLKFHVSEETMSNLESRLITLKKDFFIDKKKAIITIYDATGIEWWFVRK